MSEEIVFVRRASGLVRELSWYDVTIWALATPAASGMTYYAVKILGNPSAYGGSIALSFFIAGLMFFPLMIAFMIIAASFPRSSSLYVLVSRTLHPVFGFLPFWYFIVGGGAALCSGFLLFIGIKAMSGPLAVAGLVTGSKDFINMAEALINPVNQMIVAIVLVLVIWAINYTGMRVIKWVMRILTIIPLTVTVIGLIALLLLGPNGGLSRFDAVYGPSASSRVMEVAFKSPAAEAHGVSVLEPTDPLTGTYNMLLWTIWAWTGLEVLTFVGSEIKDPSKSYVKGYIAGYIAVMALYVANALILPWVYNYDFLAAYSYLKSEYEDVLRSVLGGKLTPDPSVPFYLSIAAGHPALAVIIGLAYFLWYVNTVIPIWVAGVRGFFSMAFDRALPEGLSQVSSRWAAPTWANHLVAVLAAFGAVMTLLENMGFAAAAALISFMDFSCLMFVWPVGLALLLLPWWRPDLFEKMVFPSKVAAAITGALTFAIGWFFMIMTSYSDPLIVLVNILVGLTGLLIYTYQCARNRAKGIDPTKIYTQIPPA
ncbi:MAG: APC family permease [Candidatus Bathyarchaeia archaeon]